MELVLGPRGSQVRHPRILPIKDASGPLPSHAVCVLVARVVPWEPRWLARRYHSNKLAAAAAVESIHMEVPGNAGMDGMASGPDGVDSGRVDADPGSEPMSTENNQTDPVEWSANGMRWKAFEPIVHALMLSSVVRE